MICRHARYKPSASADRAAERVLTLRFEFGQGASGRLAAGSAEEWIPTTGGLVFLFPIEVVA